MTQHFWPTPQNSDHSEAQLKQQVTGFSIAKMEHARRPHIDLDNIIGSPFFLTTVSIAAGGWVIAFISSIAANVKDSNFSHFAWWAIIYQLIVVLGVTIAIAYNSTDCYRLALCAFLASALSFTTSTANALIYSSVGAQQAAAAGHIFLSIVNVTWIFYFGSTSDASPHAWIDSYSLNKGPAVPGGPRPMSNAHSLYPAGRYGSPYPKTVIDNNLQSPTSVSNMSNSPAATNGTTDMINQHLSRDTMNTIATADLEFNYRAKAIYSYEANVEDPNEISFAKGETLEVAGKLTSDSGSRWRKLTCNRYLWQVVPGEECSW